MGSGAQEGQLRMWSPHPCATEAQVAPDHSGHSCEGPWGSGSEGKDKPLTTPRQVLSLGQSWEKRKREAVPSELEHQALTHPRRWGKKEVQPFPWHPPGEGKGEKERPPAWEEPAKTSSGQDLSLESSHSLPRPPVPSPPAKMPPVYRLEGWEN